MAKRDYYEVLGLDKTASQDEIKKIYRKLAKKHHPDSGGDAETFKELSEAYEILSDDDKRRKYDEFGFENPRQQGFDVRDFWANVQGVNNQHIVGENLNILIKLTLEDISTDTLKKIVYKRKSSCTSCEGHGGSNPIKCSGCNGRGSVNNIINLGHIQLHQTHTCPQCSGAGTIYQTPCGTCNSEGVLITDEHIDLNIPAGITNGMRMAMTGKGNAIKNGTTGDLIITIMELPHDKFIREGNDLKLNIKLEFHQLVLGAKVEINTIDGTKIRVSIPEYSKIGDKLRIKSKGLKQLGAEEKGDLIINLDLMTPVKLDDEERRLIEALKNYKEKLAITDSK